jgi:hypothetical protein
MTTLAVDVGNLGGCLALRTATWFAAFHATGTVWMPAFISFSRVHFFPSCLNGVAKTELGELKTRS